MNDASAEVIRQLGFARVKAGDHRIGGVELGGQQMS
jgi:hypothetical protein